MRAVQQLFRPFKIAAAPGAGPARTRSDEERKFTVKSGKIHSPSQLKMKKMISSAIPNRTAPKTTKNGQRIHRIRLHKDLRAGAVTQGKNL
jgi:hypothetical protein